MHPRAKRLDGGGYSPSQQAPLRPPTIRRAGEEQPTRSCLTCTATAAAAASTKPQTLVGDDIHATALDYHGEL
ncbi:hypothetical protein HBI49_022950 [Parastagonospora nodorum]|nr:hypothetical protein HBH50_075580 [Parastagonospora nodorum]KAH4093724.1 hypothetical protein HBH48_063830 [Parastagonospora nodorum]KAH4114276.1 hypothetical protein HBH47_198270 [Parastagonospora nodorum]KAH4609359.1 hypothetical protein HBH82_063700 [Parastagonospora nodorum]KAH4711281.1 hypothetical protein HBH67_027030 [Parastagonospora nodorum]